MDRASRRSRVPERKQMLVDKLFHLKQVWITLLRSFSIKETRKMGHGLEGDVQA